MPLEVINSVGHLMIIVFRVKDGSDNLFGVVSRRN